MNKNKRRALKPAKCDSCPPGNVAKHTGYRPTGADVAAAEEVLRKRNEQPALPAVKSGEGTKLVYDHPDQLVATCLAAVAIGSGDTRLSNGLIRQLADVAIRDGKMSGRDVNFAVAVIQGIEPKDTVEALLATQMAAVHSAMMSAAAGLAQAKFVEQQDSASMMLNKLARTFAAQIEALKRHRSAGEQTIKVEHVTVNEGGQAIVGIIHPQGGGGGAKIESQPHELGEAQASSEAYAPSPALLGHVEANGQALPGPVGTRGEGLPVSRSKGRRQRDQPTALGDTVCTLTRLLRSGGA
jgi:hypothetical protein